MHNQTLLIFSVLLCAIFVTHATPGGSDGDKDAWMEKMKKCGDGEIDVKELTKGMETCKPPQASTTVATRRRRSPDADDGGKKKAMGETSYCFAVCQWKEQGILDASGKFNETGSKEHVDKVYPEKYHAEATTKMKECATNSSSTFSMDDGCSGYKNFASCTHGAHMKICGTK